MKTVILAGGLGTRFSEITEHIPKPMVKIGGKPILWHIMEHFSGFGFDEFIIALGYKSEKIKEYFLNFHAINNDLTVDLGTGKTTLYPHKHPSWKIHLIDTGLHTQTGGRIKRLKDWIGNEPFFLTYGDGLANIDLDKLLSFHKEQGKKATVTAVRPPARFGGLTIQDHQVVEFSEKNQASGGWINGGFFVLEPSIFSYIEDDSSVWERAPLEQLALDGELSSFCHTEFWQPMDTLREYKLLESMWESGTPLWKIESSGRIL